MTEQERRALFFKATGQVYATTPMGVYNAFCKGLEAGYEAGRKDENEACAKVCDEKVEAEYATGKVDHNEMGWTQACAIAIRARREQ